MDSLGKEGTRTPYVKRAPVRYFKATNDSQHTDTDASNKDKHRGKQSQQNKEGNRRKEFKKKNHTTPNADNHMTKHAEVNMDRKSKDKKNKRKGSFKKGNVQDAGGTGLDQNKSFKIGEVQDPGGTGVDQQVFTVDIMRTERTHEFKRRGKGNFQSKLNDRKFEKFRKKRDPFPGDKPIPKSQIMKYERGPAMKDTRTRSEKGSIMFGRKEKKLQHAAKQTARTELLMQEDQGFLEADDDEDTTTITQHDLAEAVDVTSAQKFFELKLNDFGPYRINYTRNGRFLLFGGAKGHVAAIDWMTKKLLCEINVMETINDIRWLHQETMYAVAQKMWTYIYDNQGIELHCLKVLDSVLRMEFLPYHFLLATANAKGYLSYIDVSVGEKVAGYATGMGRLDVMCQNPANAVVALGHSGGTVTQWCPKMKEPVVKMLCHNSGVRSIAVDKAGQYMATSGIDRKLKIWDLRTYKMLQSYKVPAGAGQLAFSQKGLLATCMGNIVQVYRDCCRNTVTGPYLVHDLHSTVQSLQFCPYEDVLGVGHAGGFSSLIVPGAGEPNFDALETNPYQTKKQRQETEVKMLLDKIPPEMIHIDSNIISQVDKKTMQDKIEQHNKTRPYVRPQKMEYEPKYKKKGRSKGARLINRKKGVIEERQRPQIKQSLNNKQRAREKIVNENRNLTSGNVLDRFKRKEQSGS